MQHQKKRAALAIAGCTALFFPQLATHSAQREKESGCVLLTRESAKAEALASFYEVFKDHITVCYDQNPTDDRRTALVSPAFKALFKSSEGWVCLYPLTKPPW